MDIFILFSALILALGLIFLIRIIKFIKFILAVNKFSKWKPSAADEKETEIWIQIMIEDQENKD